MTCQRSGSGYKIKLESVGGKSGRLLPKQYKSLKACKIRIAQMERHSK